MKRLLKILLAVFVLVCVAILALPFLLDANQFRPLLESQLSAALNRPVKIGDLKISLMQGSVEASSITIGEDAAFGTEDFLKAQSVQIGVEMRPLILSRQVHVTRVSIEKPAVNLIANTKGDWNFSSLGKKETPPAVPQQSDAPASSSNATVVNVSNLSIIDGRATVVRKGAPGDPQIFDDVDLELGSLNPSVPIKFTLSANFAGDDVRVEGQAGPLNKAGGALPPIDAKFNVPRLDLVKSGFVDPATGIAGVTSLDGTLKGSGNRLDLSGTLKAEKWTVAKKGTPSNLPLSAVFAVSHDIAKRAGQISRATVQMGKAAVNIAGTFNFAGKAPAFVLRLNGDSVPLTELAAALPAFDIVLPAGSQIQAGTLSTKINFSGTLDNFVVTAPVEIDAAKLGGFDLGTRLRTVQLLAGLPSTPITEIETLAANVRQDPGGTTVEAITLVVPKIGDLSGAGTISPAKILDFKMRAKLHTSGAIMQAIGQKGDTTVPFLVSGTASDPVFRPDVKAIVNQKVEQLTSDPEKTVKTVQSIIDMFRKPKTDQQK